MLDQPRLAEQAQMLGDGGTADREQGADLVDRKRPLGERRDDPAPVGVGDRPEDVELGFAGGHAPGLSRNHLVTSSSGLQCSLRILRPSILARALTDSSLRVSALAIARIAMPLPASRRSLATSSLVQGWRWRTNESAINP